MKSKTWIVLFFILITIPLCIFAILIYHVDPYFHYHKPYTDKYYYTLDNERSQNDGILKHFEYEGVITGTSMCENFKSSEAEKLFGIKFIKICYSGGTYKEINDTVEKAINSNTNTKIVIRGLDTGKYIEDKDAMRNDLGEYPTYLYDDNPFNDVKYLFNKGVLLRVSPMINTHDVGKTSGITSFDDYANWMKSYQFGVHSKLLYPNGINMSNDNPEQIDLTEDEKRMVEENVEENLVKIAQNNPDIVFYYFITPYSAAWWKIQLDKGDYEKYIQAERVVIEKCLEVDNIKLFSINNRYDLTTDLNNYKDSHHYGEWINSLLLRYMRDGKYQITKDNYEEYLAHEEAFYKNFDYYTEFTNQEDYEDDYYAAELLRDEIYGGL